MVVCIELMDRSKKGKITQISEFRKKREALFPRGPGAWLNTGERALTLYRITRVRVMRPSHLCCFFS